MTAKEEIPMPEIHPLKLFRAEWNMTLVEAEKFFLLSSHTIHIIESGKYKTPKWLEEWLDDPMMSEKEIERRVQNAKVAARSSFRRRSDESNPIVQWRKSRGMSQRKAAKYFGVHWTTLSSWELGDKPIPERIIKEIEKEQSNEN